MRTVLFIIALFSGFTASSQAVITFATRSHDFGTIQEVNGAVSYNFQFTNTGTAPILVKNVESSCGCTSPEWSKQPILPGKTGYVKATFDPKDRPGFFDKTITVYSNARTPVVELKIKGTVQGKARTVLDDYPYELASGLRLPLEEISFMKARKGDVKSMSIGVFNNAGKPVTVPFANLPAHIRLAMEPAQVGNKEKAVIKASYNTRSISKSLAWTGYGDYILKNLKANASGSKKISIRESSCEENGALEYLGKYYTYREVDEP